MHEIDTKQFRRELFELIAKVDRDWVPEASSMTSDVVLPDPATQPILTKVLHSIQCFPRRANETPYLGIPWITFRSPGGAYDPRQMSEALTQRLKEKREQYLSNTKVRSLAEFVLVIHYDQALVYNTPVIGLKYGFNEAIEEAKTSLAGDSGAFTRIFVMKAVEPGGQVWKIYP
jgi:hypothetical protein